MKMTEMPAEPGPAGIAHDTRYFFYYCPKLDLWAVGRTREEAEAKLREEIRLLLTRCREYLDPAESLNGKGYATVEVRPS